MIPKFALLALVALLTTIPNAYGECVANQVQQLRIAANAVLSWEIDPNEPCEIDEFQVDVIGDKQDELRIKVRETSVDLSFMGICEEWQFIVTPISDGVPGFERRLTESIPLPPDADISIKYFNVTHITSRDVLLEWDLADHTYGDCTLRYRVTVIDEDNGEVHDLYVSETSVHLHLLSPCVVYQLSVRAVNRAHPIIEGPLKYHDHEMMADPEEPPRLGTIEIGPTNVDMTWRLENPGRNRCPIRKLLVDAGNNFNFSIPLVDTVDRPPVEVNLKDLSPNSMYFLKISVENSGGISRPALLGVQTLELSPGSE